MKKINVRQVMKRAVELAKTMIGDWVARMALALRQAWKEAKAVVANEIGAIQLGEGEKALKIGKHVVTFEYLSKTYTLDVDVKVQTKKKNMSFKLLATGSTIRTGMQQKSISRTLSRLEKRASKTTISLWPTTSD